MPTQESPKKRDNTQRPTPKDGLNYKTVWSLAGPNVISNILMVSVSFAQLVLIAPQGPAMTAAVVTGGRIQFFMMALALALSVATTAVVARAWGADDKKGAARAMAASVTLATGMAVLLGALIFFTADWSVGLFGLKDAAGGAVAYAKGMALINIVPTLYIVILAGFRATGTVMMPLWITAFSTGLTIVSSAYFLTLFEGIYGLILGVALGQGSATILLIILWLKPGSILAPKFGGWFHAGIMRSLLRIGAPSALEQLLIQISFLLYMVLIARYGTEAFAAYGIGITILSVTIVVGLGFGTASSALTGQALGAGHTDRARDSGWAATRLAVLSMSILAVVTWLAGAPIADLLTTDPTVRQLTLSFVIVLALVQPPMAVEFALGGALRGAGDTRFPLLVTFCGNILARFGLGVLVISVGFSVEWLYGVIIADYLVKSCLLIMRFKGSAWIKTLENSTESGPSALPSLAGISLAAVRNWYGRRLKATRISKGEDKWD